MAKKDNTAFAEAAASGGVEADVAADTLAQASAVLAEPAAKAEAPDEKPDGCAAGFFCYIGPSIAGVIRGGTVFRGTRADAMAAAGAAIEAQPLVRTLIVAGDDLPMARLKVKTPGNALYANYRRLAGQQ